ncbi:MAG TPA: acyltransferase [Chitinophagaceae bacterium]|nr:acyltransferase [Chitinophagaceae bacterium]
MKAPGNNTYFPSLTGVRAIAAYMVFIHHYRPFNINYFSKEIHFFFNEFHVGVTLFFVLSGFLIAYRYSELNQFNFRNYMVNRIARIYPMYLILTTITFLSYFIIKEENSIHNLIIYFANITFTRGFFENIVFSGIAQGWSLTVEETFYLLAPVFFLLIKRKKINLVILPLLSIATGLLLVAIFGNINFYGFFGSNDLMFNYTFFGRAFEFFIGITLAVIYKQKLLRTTKISFTYIGLLMILISVYGLTLFKGDFDYGIRHPFGKFINTFFLPLFGVAFFYLGLLREKTIVSKLLATNLFVLLGKSSYIFYLIHIGIFATLIYRLIPNDFILFLLINILSVLMFKYIEDPLNLYIRKKFKKRI